MAQRSKTCLMVSLLLGISKADIMDKYEGSRAQKPFSGIDKDSYLSNIRIAIILRNLENQIDISCY